MKTKILLFGGTTEGRKLTEYLSNTNVFVDVCVATEYGQQLLQKSENVNVISGRMDTEQMTAMMKQQKYKLVIDATHPYALEVTENIKKEILCHASVLDGDAEPEYVSPGAKAPGRKFRMRTLQTKLSSLERGRSAETELEQEEQNEDQDKICTKPNGEDACGESADGFVCISDRQT